MTLNEIRKEFVKQGDYYKFVDKISDEMLNSYEFYEEVYMEDCRLWKIEKYGWLSDFDVEWKDVLEGAYIKCCNKLEKKYSSSLIKHDYKDDAYIEYYHKLEKKGKVEQL